MSVRWVRAWPVTGAPAGQHVADSMERVSVGGGNYLPVLEELAGQDSVLVAWDIAVSREDVARFTLFAKQTPGRVRVAPYRLYKPSTGLDRPVWPPRVAARPSPGWVTSADEACDLFPLGMVYLPGAVTAEYASHPRESSPDLAFARWHHVSGLGPVPVTWDVKPVHVHY